MVKEKNRLEIFHIKYFVVLHLLICGVAMAANEETLTLIDSVKKICDRRYVNADTLMSDLNVQLRLTKPEDPFGLDMEGPERYEWLSQDKSEHRILNSVEFREYEQDGNNHFILTLGIDELVGMDSDFEKDLRDTGIVEIGLMADGRMETRKIIRNGFTITLIYLRINESLNKVVITGLSQN